MAIADRFYRIVVDAVTHDRLTLPTLPEVALRIQDLLRSDEISIARIVKEIQSDPALTVRLIRVANSAAVRGGRNVDSIQQAVTRLGLEYTRLLVNGLVLEQMFRSNNAALRERLRRCWCDSVEVAALARAVAAHCTLLQPEMAMLGGLVHRIGTLPILRMAEIHADAVSTPEVLDEVIAELGPKVGRMVLRAWHFPPELVELPMVWPQFDRTASRRITPTSSSSRQHGYVASMSGRSRPNACQVLPSSIWNMTSNWARVGRWRSTTANRWVCWPRPELLLQLVARVQPGIALRANLPRTASRLRAPLNCSCRSQFRLVFTAPSPRRARP